MAAPLASAAARMSPTQPRTTAVDTLRVLALFGICVVNLPYLGLTPAQLSAAPATPLDAVVTALVSIVFTGKFYTIFSFVFGWGFGIQMASAARAGASFGGRYGRRVLGLALIGLAHATLVFTGDILVIYAIVGALLFPLRNRTAASLWRLAKWMVGVAVLVLIGLVALMVMDTAGMPEPDLGGGFAEATRARIGAYPDTLGFLLLFQGPLAFAAMLTGLAASKVDFFNADSPARKRLAHLAPRLFVLALPLAVIFPHDDTNETLLGLVGLLLYPFGASMMAAVFVHLFLKLADRFTLPAWLSAAGQNSLTTYVLQGVLAGLVFGAYGLGLYGDVGHLGLFALSIVLTLVAMLLTNLLRFGGSRAPLERLLRRITYGPSR